MTVCKLCSGEISSCQNLLFLEKELRLQGVLYSTTIRVSSYTVRYSNSIVMTVLQTYIGYFLPSVVATDV